MKRPLTMAGLIAVTIGGVVLSGCAPTTQASDDTLRATIDTPATFDPTLALSLPDFQLARLSFDTLVRRDESGVVAGLASEWQVDPTSALFTIREGATCSDGTPITPTVVADSLSFYVSDGEPQSVAETFAGNTPVITADDAAGTVSITVDQPTPDLLNSLTSSNTGIICPAGLADPDGLKVGPVEGAESGPYVLASFEPGVRYSYQLRDDYDAWPEWTTDVEGVPPATLEYVVATDPSATANLTLSGDLDVSRIAPDSRTRFEGVDGITVSSFPFGTFYLVFNEREGSPFVDRDVRIGVAEAIDRVAFEKTTTDGTGELATTLASSATECVTGEDSPALIPYDPDAAAKVLAGVKIRLIGAQVVGSSGSGNTFVEESLRQAGAEVTLDNVDIGTWAGRTFGEPDSWDLTIYPDLNFLGSIGNSLLKFDGPEILDGGPNVGGADDPEAAKLFAQARSTADLDERCDLYNQAADSLIADAHTVPLVIEAYIYAQREGFKVYMLGGSLDDHIFRIV